MVADSDQAVYALLVEANARFDRGRWEDGIEIYDELVERFGADDSLYVRSCVAAALAYKAHMLRTQRAGGRDRSS